MRKKFVIGNWKLHGSLSFNKERLSYLKKANVFAHAELAVCVPFPYLAQCQQLLEGGAIAWGAQDVSAYEEGAYTGEVAAAMLAEFGTKYVLVGHSERRMYHAETDEQVALKTRRVLEQSMTPVVCVGETLAQREQGETEKIVQHQLSAVLDVLNQEEICRLVVAYEPVWAIGTGKIATCEQAQAVHQVLRACLFKKIGVAAENSPIIYGGSVKLDNAKPLCSMPDIDGVLVGGASLDAAQFFEIYLASVNHGN